MERYSKDTTKCYTQNFNPGLTLIGPSGTGAGPGGYIICSFRWMSLASFIHDLVTKRKKMEINK